MKFSVVIPAYNDEDTVLTAVHSALDQASVCEVIVVDDGSSDSTVDRLRAVADARLTVIEQPNGGPSSARNTGAAAATGTYLVFVDADDHLLPDATETFAGTVGDADIVRSGAIMRSTTDRVALATPTPFDFPRGAPLPGTFAIRRTVFETIGGYDELLRYGENSELLFRAQREARINGGGTTFVATPTLLYNESDATSRERYRPYRLAAAERLLELQSDLLEDDRETLHNYSAVAAELRRQQGDRRAAFRHGVRALRAKPTSTRSWARLGLIALGMPRGGD